MEFNPFHPLLALVTDVSVEDDNHMQAGHKRRLCVLALDGTVLFKHFIPVSDYGVCFRWAASGAAFTFCECGVFYAVVFSSLSPHLRPAVHELLGGGQMIAPLGSWDMPAFGGIPMHS